MTAPIWTRCQMAGSTTESVGCMGGLAVCETLIQDGRKLKHPLEVVVFTDEEGFRFGSGLLGSSALCGEELDIHPEDLDIEGKTRREVFEGLRHVCRHVAKEQSGIRSRSTALLSFM